MNLANFITLIRIFLIPIIIILIIIVPTKNGSFYNIWNEFLLIKRKNFTYSLPISYLISGILFIIASLTDLLDGFIARKYNKITIFGKFFDSIADKLLTNTVLIIFTCTNIIPIWITILLISRDFIIDIVRQILAIQKIIMDSNKLGKIRTTIEMFGLSILFFFGFNMFDNYSKKTILWNEFGIINQIIMIPMYLSTILSIISASNYIILYKKLLFNSKIIKK